MKEIKLETKQFMRKEIVDFRFKNLEIITSRLSFGYAQDFGSKKHDFTTSGMGRLKKKSENWYFFQKKSFL